MSENKQAWFFLFFLFCLGCAGQGDYEYRKHQEAKQIKHEAAKDAAVCK